MLPGPARKTIHRRWPRVSPVENRSFPCTGMTGAPAKIVASANERLDILRLCSSTAAASRTASLAFCSSESGGARWAS